MFIPSLLLVLQLWSVRVEAQGNSPTALAEQLNLTTSTKFPFPTATASSVDTQALILSEWSPGKGRIQENPNNLAFVGDPYPDKPVDSEATVTYPARSYSHASGGGAQFYNLWNATDGLAFGSMLLSYEIAFEEGFNWVKGGKLPGLRGGLNSTGCSGGKLASGMDCFSTRLMWRTNGNGEIYAYIPETDSLCDRKDVACNDDFGISLNRGSFVLTSGRWMRFVLYVQMNSPPRASNGKIQLYYNDRLVLSQEGLQMRSTSTASINGLFFSTFFGGADETYATPVTTFTYFRNIQLWGSTEPSSSTGASRMRSNTITPLSFFIPMFLALVPFVVLQ
ncbi:hypothetical protein FA15DRAFT_686395 [Coprinopsis marcescibilis]|uniref:Polysaccharide lyase 14 domain-containing protein n=1 Tax=Coprinopsis marcescibilis TaxID=230819 RepID=A0A5C3L2P9_COPMA|nr:hypothetical protein FA15DRAFT_686395 [Coprinopsis marcescibilis]